MGYPWAYKVRIPDESKGSSRKPDYFKILGAPIVVLGASAYVLLMMDPPLWAVLGFLGLSALMIVGAYAYLSLEKEDIERVKKYGPGGYACEICGVGVNAMGYESHLWRRHYDASKAMERMTRHMIWWVLGIIGLTGAFVFTVLGPSIASLVVFIAIGPLLGVIVSIGITLQVRWPRLAARAKKEWFDTHPGWDPKKDEP